VLLPIPKVNEGKEIENKSNPSRKPLSIQSALHYGGSETFYNVINP